MQDPKWLLWPAAMQWPQGPEVWDQRPERSHAYMQIQPEMGSGWLELWKLDQCWLVPAR